ncbi:DeoR family transcriptional regulator [Marispirochaeta aestuarii]|uniref:DeoR family transcriptional regulator n=2 Tax=Marispirochaeta aestuarii TaxID=1963862 RepID=A0A1Y1RUR1_9SPIO|nr:DeoR/GlpR family DNA-binding transcription regulator [Marispirochaeta aestuarii]ORC32739.1 DeoR family transcriptional regulator [Marispirochaeta aestuarii]
MFAVERNRIIKNFLRENRQVEVHALSSMLNVSEVTIRRDLEKLERDGILTRTHGGAVLREIEESVQVEKNPDVSQDSREIASVALNMIEDGDVIMLTGGDICDCIARRIVEKNGITVLTNYIPVATEIARQPANRVVLLGGDVADDGRSLYGSLSVANLRRFHVNRLFAEVEGIDENLEVSVASHEKAELIEAAMESAEEKILLCLGDNFNRNAFFRLGSLKLADKVITNPSISDEYKHQIFVRNIQLHTSINVFEGRV